MSNRLVVKVYLAVVMIFSFAMFAEASEVINITKNSAPEWFDAFVFNDGETTKFLFLISISEVRSQGIGPNGHSAQLQIAKDDGSVSMKPIDIGESLAEPGKSSWVVSISLSDAEARKASLMIELRKRLSFEYQRYMVEVATFIEKSEP